MISPPRYIITFAEGIARRSPCAKSKRGVVLYHPSYPDPFGWGHNGQPKPLACTGTEACRASCRMICCHAEERAVRDVLRRDRGRSGLGTHLELVHVKVDSTGALVGGGPPSCVQCSRTILDVGWIARVWLYETTPEEWCPHTNIPRTDCGFCQGEQCNECHVAAATANPRPTCDHDVLDRHHGLPSADARWRSYSALDFHRITLANEGHRP